jgi:predicted MFS family arabinose efflux permease
MTAAMRGESFWSPFRHRAFSVIWTATVVSSIGGWMYSATAAWLMTSHSRDPLMVSLVQVASSLPTFLFAIPGGALADGVDKRRFLLLVEIIYTALALGFAAAVAVDAITPASLLLFVLLLSTCTAMLGPAYQSIVPLLVPREALAPAVAANSVGVNISRALGPALGGMITATSGAAAPLWLNAFGNVTSIGALWWWRPPERPQPLPAERLMASVRSGIRYARYDPPLRATLVRAVAFFLFASSYWALLPLVARDQIAGGAEIYGFLLGAIGAGAIGGAFVLPTMQKRLGADRTVACGSLGTALAVVVFGAAHDVPTALAASLIAGASWIAAVSTLNLSAQVALPDWVRSRGLAVYITAFFGALTVGSFLWGQAARAGGVPLALYAAAAGIVLTIPLTWRWKLHKGAAIDFAPSMHWPSPVVSGRVEDDAGPVLVTVEYRVDPAHRDAFLAAMRLRSAERRRDGAYSWGVFEDTASPGLFVESFQVESWLEHMRQHQRVTRSDQEAEAVLRGHLLGDSVVRHFVAPKG